MIHKYKPLLVFGFLLAALSGNAQDEKNDPDYRVGKWYFSNETEIIFSFADIESDSTDIENILRWSPVFNYMGRINYDINKHLGFDIGLGLRNVGFIAKFPGTDPDLKKKFRTYNLGLPIGIKIGDLNQEDPFFIFAGFELEMPFHYKEKTFENGDKNDKITGWFSDRTERFTQSAYAGVQFQNGVSLKFKYYLKNFFNKNYTFVKDDLTLKPYADMDVHVFYFSLTIYPFKDSKSYEIDVPKEEFKTAAVAGWY